MAIIISHISALQLMSAGQVTLAGSRTRPSVNEWVLGLPPLHIPTKQRKVGPSPNAPRQEDMRFVIANRWGISLPIHVLVGNSAAIRNGSNLVCHAGQAVVREKLFFPITQNVYCCIPELCFLQLAARLPLIDLIVLGYEMCGFYAAQATGFSSMIKRRPLTTVSKIKKFLEAQPTSKGMKNAQRAIQYVVDGSASPAETTLTILLSLPHRMGGYALEKPLLNHRIAKTSAAYTLAAIQTKQRPLEDTSQDTAICDLYWPKRNLIMEYDSSQEHSGSNQIEKDARRRNDLTPEVRILTATNKQLAYMQSTDHLAALTAKHLKQRIRVRIADHAKRKRRLRLDLNRIHQNHWLSPW